jgi:hypothetical protein
MSEDSEFIEASVACDAAPNLDELQMMLKGISSGRT